MLQKELLNIITGSETDENTVKLRLTDLITDYPWFGTPHYFLLQKLDKNDPGYSAMAAKTALHFPNSLLLQHRLNNFEATAQNEISTENIPAEYDHIKNDLQREQHLHMLEKDVEKEKIASNNKDVSDSLENDLPSKVIEEIKTNETVFVEKEIVENKKEENFPAKDEMLFEPLFATDYFASQGIKLSEQIKPTDKLGLQVKSFTDWLKTMKKSPGTQQANGMQVDTKVAHLAEKSNAEAEVVTESMADVYFQQGHQEKAAEIYHKLSLLNPAKSAYFAAKIEHLKSDGK
ncbi:MAG: hypothetical protein ABIY51_15720 [Ferruginibacter sp.]